MTPLKKFSRELNILVVLQCRHYEIIIYLIVVTNQLNPLLKNANQTTNEVGLSAIINQEDIPPLKQTMLAGMTTKYIQHKAQTWPPNHQLTTSS